MGKPRGFAAMDRALVSEIARRGGKAAHAAGTAHEFTQEEARAAGRKGGKVSHLKRNAAKAPAVLPPAIPVAPVVDLDDTVVLEPVVE